MATQKLTEWFPGHVNPARPGVYQRGRECWYGRWSGRAWMLTQASLEMAARSRIKSVNQDNLVWRGLAERP